MSTPRCPYPAWCETNHDDPLDDFDGRGSRFHRSAWLSWRPTRDPAVLEDDTWCPPSDEKRQLTVWEDADLGRSAVRLCDDDMSGNDLTEPEVRAYAQWLVELADRMAAMNAEAATPSRSGS